MTTLLDRPVAPAGGETTEMPALEVRNVSVSFRTRDGLVRAVNDISFTLGAGRMLAISRRVLFWQERFGAHHAADSGAERAG